MRRHLLVSKKNKKNLLQETYSQHLPQLDGCCWE
jgi:hypothetical protein